MCYLLPGPNVPHAYRVVAAHTFFSISVASVLIHTAHGHDELAVGAENGAGNRAVMSGQLVEQPALQIQDSSGAVVANSNDSGAVVHNLVALGVTRTS